MNSPATARCRQLRSIIKATPVVLNDDNQAIVTQSHANLQLIGMGVTQDIVNSLGNNPVDGHLSQTRQLKRRNLITAMKW